MTERKEPPKRPYQLLEPDVYFDPAKDLPSVTEAKVQYFLGLTEKPTRPTKQTAELEAGMIEFIGELHAAYLNDAVKRELDFQRSRQPQQYMNPNEMFDGPIVSPTKSPTKPGASPREE